jgi:hypothetical protein
MPCGAIGIAPHLVEGIAKALFRDDRETILAAYNAYDDVEFTGQWPEAAR